MLPVNVLTNNFFELNSSSFLDSKCRVHPFEVANIERASQN